MTAKPIPRYEVMIQRDGRWAADRQATTEIDALLRAQALFTDHKIMAVRVLHSRVVDGQPVKAPILERNRRAARLTPPQGAPGAGDEETVCGVPEDLYGASSRRAMGRLLRPFLDRISITPTELLHHYRYICQLDDDGTVLHTALSRIAALQARADGETVRDRMMLLQGFVKRGTERARDALAAANAPQLGEGGLIGLHESVVSRTAQPFAQRFWLRHGASRALEECSNGSARLRLVLSWVVEPMPAPVAELIDELIAGLLGMASVTKEMLGYEPHLAAALASLTELAAGRLTRDRAGTPLRLPLAHLFARAPMPEARAILLDRLQREVAGDVPLSRDEPGVQRRLLDELIASLVDGSGLFVGGAAMVEALARRCRQLDLVGGIESLRTTAAEPAARLVQLLERERPALAERQQRALATCIVETLGELRGMPADLRLRLETMRLPPALRQTVLARLPPAG